MKTIKLKWIEDDNHVVAEDAYTGLKELIETGVFPNLKVNCEDDILYITGEKEDLDKAVMKIQKAYAKYGQIMIKEAKNGTSNELRIESFDDNVQDIFNHTLNDYETFKEALHYVNERLAKNLVRDGEGATKFIEVNVNGAATEADAKTMAKSVVKSSLVKAAMFGEDANWGRVLCAMGYSGVKFDATKVDIVFASEKGDILLMDNGTPIVFDEDKAADILSEKEITVNIKITEGDAKATAWGCDLSYDYVRINGDYRS